MVMMGDVCIQTYHVIHFDYLKPPVQFRDEIRRARECDSTRSDKPPKQFGVLTNTLTKWAALARSVSIVQVSR